MRRRPVRAGAAALAAVLATTIGAAGADPSDPSPAVEERRQSPAEASAESEYMRGVRARVIADWPAAEAAFRGAIALEPTHAEAWNELGYALRNQGRYADSLDAYHEALRLRPEFPEALEYLGEAYVKLGRVEDARRVLARLRVLDLGRAQELAEVIEKGE